MENEQRLVFIAEKATVDTERSDIFLLIDFRLFDNGGNLNKQGVTAAFIQSVIDNQEKYDALPLYADTENLLSGRYDDLGHNYNSKTGEFNTEQIGGLTRFVSTNENGLVTLYATARVPKRQTGLCRALAEMYAEDKLHVSFEVKYNPDNTVMKDGVLFVDAADDNVLTGMCVVSVPAFKNADALNMVAESMVDQQNAGNNEVNEMDKENMTLALGEVVVDENEKLEYEKAECKKEDAECKREDAEAEAIHEEVVVREEIHDDPNSECPPVHVTETVHRVVETIEPEQPKQEEVPDHVRVIAEKDARIAELEKMISELTVVKEAYDKIMAEAAEKELAEKRARIGAFAESQGLDVNDVAVAEAVNKIDYEAIANLTMAKNAVAEEHAVASVRINNNITADEYGGLLLRKGTK